MDAGTQSAVLIVWALLWMLSLSLMMVHPLFGPTRNQIRRSVRLRLHRWRTARRLLQYKIVLWLLRVRERRTQRAEQSRPPTPLWLRFLVGLLSHFFLYVFWHLICRQPITWTYVFGYLVAGWTIDGVKLWAKRRKERLEAPNPEETPPVKPANEQSAKQEDV